MDTQWTPEMSRAITELLRSILANVGECPQEVLNAAVAFSPLWVSHPFNSPEFYLGEVNA